MGEANRNFNIYKPELFATVLDWRYDALQKLFTMNGDKLQWKGGESVLDLGCGLADITRRIILPMLPPDYKKLVCGDVSTVMLNAARKELQGVKNVEFMELNIEDDLESSLEGSFDKIFSTYCLMYQVDQRKTYENIFKLLAPGGECFVVLLVTGIIFETGFQLAETPKWREHLKHFRQTFVFPYREDPDPVKTLSNLLQSVGFCDVFVEKDSNFCLYPTVQSLRDNIRVMPSYPNNMTQQEKEELFEDQVKLGMTFNAVVECRDESKPIRQARHVALTIHARKPKSL